MRQDNAVVFVGLNLVKKDVSIFCREILFCREKDIGIRIHFLVFLGDLFNVRLHTEKKGFPCKAETVLFLNTGNHNGGLAITDRVVDKRIVAS